LPVSSEDKRLKRSSEYNVLYSCWMRERCAASRWARILITADVSVPSPIINRTQQIQNRRSYIWIFFNCPIKWQSCFAFFHNTSANLVYRCDSQLLWAKQMSPRLTEDLLARWISNFPRVHMLRLATIFTNSLFMKVNWYLWQQDIAWIMIVKTRGKSKINRCLKDR
jgi:hypothetical protein